MKEIFEIANKNQQRAWEIIEQTQLVSIWESFNAKVNLVGSLKTGLLMKNRDIDFHIYSDRFDLADSFAAIAKLAQNNRIKRIEYTNLLDTEEMCVEWHAWYLDTDEQLWQIDMIHILNESPYAGRFEKVAQRIKDVLIDETKHAILSIKNDVPPDKKVMGIEIYQAVIRDGVRNYNQFMNWKQNTTQNGIIDWMP